MRRQERCDISATLAVQENPSRSISTNFIGVVLSVSELFFTCFKFKWQTDKPNLFKTKLTRRSWCFSKLPLQFENLLKNPMIGFIETHVNTCRLNIPKSSNIPNLRCEDCESILSGDLHLEFGFAIRWSQQRSTKSIDPQWNPQLLCS